ncbi:MAG TPA: STAS domain-containing protein [Polyangiaceae bacterium]
MPIPDLDQRLHRIVDALSSISAGEFATAHTLAEGEDLLGRVERSVNDVMMDLQTLELSNREKNASLEAQQQALGEKLATIARQSETLRIQEAEIEAKLAMIDRQKQAIRALMIPVLEIDDGIVALPIVGVVDSTRAADLTTTLLTYISERGVRCVILDLTGVELIDTSTADHLLKVERAAALMGARCVLTGIGPEIAQTMVALGVDLTQLRTLRSMKEGLRDSRSFIVARNLVREKEAGNRS